ncbi:MAG: DUF58 domain-containing protein [Halieaceae bacterium]|jgi:uncharacterized protein (DUF58 family)|nr:DUF58 domain-containing protein [Halieaceae bacterium]
MAAAPDKAPARGAYCTLAELIEQRYAATRIDLGQRKRALSLLSGPNKTNFRGRGIDFEEVRSYQPGDDIRTIDWRITARTGEAHTKVFREERERQVLICVDQRSSMFFGSRHCCKSVLAARLAALLAWSALNRGDRVGGLVFNEATHEDIRPRRSRRAVLGLLHAITDMNGALPLDPAAGRLHFADILTEIRRIARPGSALYIISDFTGALQHDAREQLDRLAQHLEITALHCSDPLERSLPDKGSYAVTDGQRRARLYTGDRRLRSAFSARFQEQLDALREANGRLGIPLIEASTDQSPLNQLQMYYAGGGGSR